jgi:hypothetical protein
MEVACLLRRFDDLLQRKSVARKIHYVRVGLRADATIPTHPQSVIHHYQSGRSRKSGFRSLHRYQRS